MAYLDDQLKCLDRQAALVGPLRSPSAYLLHIIVYGISG
jgi:hypothetical protein